jgi:secondary thiamine-phosphate synthase enzyme
MKQSTTLIDVPTRGKGLYLCTDQVASFVAKAGITTGLLTVFIQHTSASLVIQENADPDVQYDLTDYFERLAPERDPRYRHTLEGPDDMPAHLRSALTATQLSIPVMLGRMALGTWQGIYVFEHRRQATRRTLALHLMGE